MSAPRRQDSFNPQLNRQGGVFLPGHDGDRCARIAVLAARHQLGADKCTYAQLAEAFGGSCAPNTAQRWCEAYDATGATGAAQRGRPEGSGAVFGRVELYILKLLVYEHPMLTIAEYMDTLRLRYGLEASKSTISRALDKLQLTSKTREKVHSERYSQHNILRIHAFLAARGAVPRGRVVAVDEVGFHVGAVGRHRGRSDKGCRLYQDGLRDNEGTRCVHVRVSRWQRAPDSPVLCSWNAIAAVRDTGVLDCSYLCVARGALKAARAHAAAPQLHGPVYGFPLRVVAHLHAPAAAHPRGLRLAGARRRGAGAARARRAGAPSDAPLLPALQDNARFHRPEIIKAILNAAGVHVLWLPAHCPHLC